MGELGSYALLLSLLVCLIGIAAGLFAGIQGRDEWTRIAERSMLLVFGATSVATNRLVLNSIDVPPNSVGYMLAGRTPGFLVHFGSSQGILCLSGNILRFSGSILQTGQTGSMSFRADLMDFPMATAVIPGDTWYFQSWYRDVGGTNNFSDAICVDFL